MSPACHGVPLRPCCPQILRSASDSRRSAVAALEIISGRARRGSRERRVALPRLWWAPEELVPTGCRSASLHCCHCRSRAVASIRADGRWRPRRPGRPRVRPRDRDRLEPAARQPGRLLGGGLLAAPAGPDRGRRPAGPARTAGGPTARPRRAGPGPVCRRRLPHPSPRRGNHVAPISGRLGRPGSQHQLVRDADGILLAVSLTGGNRHDSTQLIPLVDVCRRSAAGLATVRRSCWPIAATTTTSTAPSCAPGTTPRIRRA
jgi:hypothetical protein